jgi:hypothetical protein
MGYLIESSNISNLTVTIPESYVQTMDSTNSFKLVNTNSQFCAIPLACFIKIAANQTTQYVGFNHLHLTNTGGYVPGRQVATYSINASSTNDLQNGLIYSMLINFQSAPNRFGGVNFFNPLEIFFDTVPTAGDGDMIVTLQYTTITI